MDALWTGRLHRIEAVGRRDFCRPVRMQGLAWGTDESVRCGIAWRKALFTGAVWRRASVVALVAVVLGGAAGVRAWGTLGMVVACGAVLTQCWQSVDLRRRTDQTRMN